jgi:hypothetical protein
VTIRRYRQKLSTKDGRIMGGLILIETFLALPAQRELAGQKIRPARPAEEDLEFGNTNRGENGCEVSLNLGERMLG